MKLTGSLTVALPVPDAVVLFTPRGERRWAPGWDPHFPDPVEDDAAPGTVFETHGTTWLVVDREPTRIRYARLTPGRTAGTVTVALADAAGHSDVTVTYELTALTVAGRDHLREFATGYRAYLASWQEAIAAALAKEG